MKKLFRFVLDNKSSESQKRGYVFLAILIIMVTGIFNGAVFYSNNNNLLATAPKKSKKDFVKFTSENKEIIEEIEPFDINLADSAKFCELKGIGPKTSSRILKYRKKIGYFEKIEDLKKVYGLEKIWENVEPFIFVNSSNFPKIELKSTDNQIFVKKDLNLAKPKDLFDLKILDKKTIFKILNYRDKIKGYKSMEQVKKVYDLKEEEFEIITENFYVIESEETNFEEIKSDKFLKSTKTIVKIDLNQVDSVSLEALPKIGPATASRIIKFRNKLGFFASKDQINEVYGISPEAVQLLDSLSYVSYDQNVVTKIKINVCNEKQLLHPYLDYTAAKIIVAYRNQHGKFENFDSLKNIKALDSNKLEKLKPYLEF